MKPAEILQQIQAQLKNSTYLDYVSDSQVYLGVREGMSIFPCIIIEPMNLKEDDDCYPKKRITMSVAVIGFIKAFDKDKQIAGDTNTKGVMDLENDIKKALCSDITLSGKVIDLNIKETLYEFVDYPERSVTINVEILYEQISTTRA